MKRRRRATLENIDFMISRIKTEIDRFYFHHGNLGRAINPALLDDRALVGYKEAVDNANEWINNVRITRSFVSVESDRYLHELYGMMNRIIRNFFVTLGRDALYPKEEEEEEKEK